MSYFCIFYILYFRIFVRGQLVGENLGSQFNYVSFACLCFFHLFSSFHFPSVFSEIYINLSFFLSLKVWVKFKDGADQCYFILFIYLLQTYLFIYLFIHVYNPPPPIYHSFIPGAIYLSFIYFRSTYHSFTLLSTCVNHSQHAPGRVCAALRWTFPA